MSGLFIELYLDEDVSVLVAELLRARGHTAVTTRDDGRLGSTDEEQLAHATKQGLTILTHNREHFVALAERYFTEGRSHAGFLIAMRRLPQEIVRRLLTILDHVTADEMRNQVRYL